MLEFLEILVLVSYKPVSYKKTCTRQQTQKKLVSRYDWKDSMKCLKAPCVKTSRQSFETDSASQSFFIQIFCACTSYGISSLSPKATEKKEVCKTMCDRKGENSRFGINPMFYLRDCTMLPSPRRRPANITNQSRCYLPPRL